MEKEYLVYGNVTFSGAWGIVTAETAEDAKRKALAGEIDWDSSGASLSDWTVSSVQENE